MSLRQQALHDSQLYGEGADTGKFNAKKESEKEATKTDAERKSDVISTPRHLSLGQKDLHETRNPGLGGGEDSGTGGK